MDNIRLNTDRQIDIWISGQKERESVRYSVVDKKINEMNSEIYLNIPRKTKVCKVCTKDRQTLDLKRN